jgi:hypothetical protein
MLGIMPTSKWEVISQLLNAPSRPGKESKEISQAPQLLNMPPMMSPTTLPVSPPPPLCVGL